MGCIAAERARAHSTEACVTSIELTWTESRGPAEGVDGMGASSIACAAVECTHPCMISTNLVGEASGPAGARTYIKRWHQSGGRGCVRWRVGR